MKKLILFIILSIIGIIGCTNDPVKVSNLVISHTSLELVRGESQRLTIQISPDDAHIDSIIWSSDKPEIALVDANGVVNALVPGNTTIRVKVNELQALCALTVKELPIDSIILSETELELTEGSTAKISSTILPEEADTYNITYESENNGIATVDNNGLITAVSSGETDIIASCAGMKAKCHVTVTTISNIKVGDYYYSDGTYSTTLDQVKTPIGIVFWVGNPTKDDESLKRDHPGCTNGLVVSLNGETGGPWQRKYKNFNNTVGRWISENTDDYFSPTTKTGATDNLNKTVGYNNTKAIELFNAASENSLWPVDVINSVISYRAEVKAPESSSDWYLPSAKELFLLCAGNYKGNIWGNKENLTANRDLINSVLETIPESTPLSDSYYWCSSEYDNDRAFDIYFHSCFVDMPDKNNMSGKVRCILAF